MKEMNQIPDQSELRITSALDYKMYKEMSKEELLGFIIRDTQEKARKFVHPEWMDSVHVICIYTVIDSAYTKKEIVTARLVYAHMMGASGNITSIKKL